MKKMILVCDDEEGVRESLKLILEKDYDIHFAANGTEAIEGVGKISFQLLILDIKMPKIDGIETLKRVKAIRPGIKTMISSGYKSVDIAKAASDAGAEDYIVKPFDSAAVLSAVKRLIG